MTERVVKSKRCLGQDLMDLLLGDADPLVQRVRIERLGQYNAERQRGIQHYPDWDAFMRREQKWFDGDDG